MAQAPYSAGESDSKSKPLSDRGDGGTHDGDSIPVGQLDTSSPAAEDLDAVDEPSPQVFRPSPTIDEQSCVQS